MTSISDEQMSELRESFAHNDPDGNGRISLEEFMRLLEDLDAGVSAGEARRGFREIDSDQDGGIEFEEFVAWWTSP